MTTTEKKFSVKALREMDREVLNKAEWTEAELSALTKAAGEANIQVASAEMSAVAQQSAAAYVLDRLGKFKLPGEKKTYGQAINKSITRVSDYVLYGYAAVKHDIGFDTPLFNKLKQGASGGHRAKIGEVLAKDEIDLKAFEALLDEAIAEEKRKADERAENRRKSAEAKANDPMGGKAHTPENLLAALTGVLAAISGAQGKFDEAEADALRAGAEILVAVAAVPLVVEETDTESADVAA